MRIRVMPYMKGSRGAKAIAHALGGKRLRFVNSRYRRRETDILINWGASAPPHLPSVGNDPDAIKSASNKLLFFRRMKAAGVTCIPEFWENKEDIPDDSYPVVCRTLLCSHSGRGIVIADSSDDLVDANLYVKYLKKKDEYRVHCGVQADGSSTVIAVQRKARRLNSETVDWQVRNHANGFVYVRNDVNPPACVIEAALEVFRASSLVFGAVDVIYNEKHDAAYVLEINTAPGLQGQTVFDYASFFKEKINAV